MVDPQHAGLSITRQCLSDRFDRYALLASSHIMALLHHAIESPDAVMGRTTPGTMRPAKCSWPVSNASHKASNSSRRKSRESTRTGRKNPGRHATHRVPSGESPPPGTTQWRMMDQGLPPGVEDCKEADPGTKMVGISGNGPQRLGGRPEEEAIDDGLVLERDRRDRRGHGEDDVEVVHGEQVGPARLDPRGAGQRLTRRAVAIATRVVPDPLVPTLVALLHVTTQSGGPALRNRGHDAPRGRRQRAPATCWLPANKKKDPRYAGISRQRGWTVSSSCHKI